MGFVWPIMLGIDTAFSKLAETPYEGSMPQEQRSQDFQFVKDRWVQA